MPASQAACDAFSAVVPRAKEWPALADVLGTCLDRAHAAWPSLQFDAVELARHLAQKLKPVDLGALDTAHVEDLALAFACLQHQPVALQVFDASVLPRIDPVVRRYDADDLFVDEVRQTLRQKLFMSPPRIGEYSGHGPLVSWLRAAAARTALNQLRPEKRQLRADTDELDQLPHAAHDPELAILKGRHQAAFRAAFAAALADVPTRERTALKLNALEGVSLEKIGAMYGKDKSTVSRWVSHAQDVLLEKTREHLAHTLDLQTGDVESLMVALKSQLASSLVNLLGEKSDATK